MFTVVHALSSLTEATSKDIKRLIQSGLDTEIVLSVGSWCHSKKTFKGHLTILAACKSWGVSWVVGGKHLGCGAQRWHCWVRLLRSSPLPWLLCLCPLSPDWHFPLLHNYKISASASCSHRPMDVVLSGGGDAGVQQEKDNNLFRSWCCLSPLQVPVLYWRVFVGMYMICFSTRIGLHTFSSITGFFPVITKF